MPFLTLKKRYFKTFPFDASVFLLFLLLCAVATFTVTEKRIKYFAFE